MDPIFLLVFSWFLDIDQQNPRGIFENVILSLEVVSIATLWPWNAGFHDSNSYRWAQLFNELLHLFKFPFPHSVGLVQIKKAKFCMWKCCCLVVDSLNYTLELLMKNFCIILMSHVSLLFCYIINSTTSFVFSPLCSQITSIP